jgi:predicted RNase H-like HicB family nuclease
LIPKKYGEMRQALKAAGCEYLVGFERGEDGGWWACLPDLPGVVALGSGRREVAARIQEALDAFASEIAALGRRLPEPVAATGTIGAAYSAAQG